MLRDLISLLSGQKLSRERFRSHSLYSVVFVLGTFVCLAMFIRLGWNGFITDSEIWAVTVAKNFSSDWYQPWVFTRVLFYGTLWASVAWVEEAVPIIFTAKVVSLGVGLAIALLVFRISQKLTRLRPTANPFIPWFATFILFANTAFLNQGSRIRSDLFACMLVLFTIDRTLKMIIEKKAHRAQLLALWILPLLATPKAVIQLLPAAVFLPLLAPSLEISKESRKKILFACGTALLVLAPFYFDSLRYLFASVFGVRKTDGALLILTEESFFFISRTIRLNPIFIGLMFFRAIFLYVRVHVKGFSSELEEKTHKRFFWFCLLEFLAVLALPDRFPFIIASLVPPMAIFAAQILDDIEVLIANNLLSAKFRLVSSFSWLFVAFGLFAGAFDWAASCVKGDLNEDQYTLIRYLETYLANYPKALYFDGIGIVPQRAFPRRFVGPNDDTANNSALQWLTDGNIQETGEAHRPDLVFFITKLHLLEPQFPAILERDYTHIGQGIYGRWETLPQPLPAVPESRESLRETIANFCRSVGLPGKAADHGRFRFLIRSADGAIKTSDATLDDILRPEIRAAEPIKDKRKAKKRVVAKPPQPVIEKVSVFTELRDPPPLRIPVVFSFDSNF